MNEWKKKCETRYERESGSERFFFSILFIFIAISNCWTEFSFRTNSFRLNGSPFIRFPTAHLRFYTAHAYASFGIYIIFKNSIITRTFTMQKSILKWRLSIFRAPDALLIYTVKRCLLWKCASYETPRCVKRLRLCVSIWWEEKRSGFHKIHLRCTKAQWNIAKIIYFIFNVFAISRFAFESMGINRCSFCAE